MSKQEKFIEESSIKFKYKYDYSKVKYVNIKTKVIIICPNHGEFTKTPHHHNTRRQGCPKCVAEEKRMINRKDVKKFTNEANGIHNFKYDYSNVNYYNTKSKVRIICSEHGIFEQTPDNHLQGQGCPKCSGKKLNTEDIIRSFIKTHGTRYTYTEVEYSGSNAKVNIICKKHGKFKQLPYSHISGQGCPKCSNTFKSNTEDFITKSSKVHGDKYNYSKVEYISNKRKVIIICGEHGEFTQTPNMHLQGNGCPICKESVGEKRIRSLLIENGIKYIPQHTFDGCRNTLPLPFDFYLPEYGTCIEYDGIQHFKPIPFFGGKKTFIDTKSNDEIKNQFCKTNGVELFRLNYYEDVEESFNNWLTNK
jgi:hypothetical protein